MTLRVRPLPGSEGLRVEVEDTGPGVPAEQRHLLFRDFVQLATPGAASEGMAFGTGLGLSIAAQLAELMGGRIGCDSEPGQGALFWVELPLPAAPAARLAGPQEELATPPLPATAAPMRILVADDVPANRLVARAMLTSAGHHVTCVEDGAAALAAVQQNGFDMVLMDLQMPVMDGLEATRRIRALPPPQSHVPVLAVTASAMPEQVEACHAAGMDGHLAKPIDRETLLRMVQRFGEQRGKEADASPLVPAMAPAALLDPEVGKALVSDLADAAPAVLQQFVAELENGRDSLAALMATPDTEAIRTAAHRLAGVARTLGAARLSEALDALRQAVAAGEPPLPGLITARDVLEETLPELRGWAQRVEAHAAPGTGPGGEASA
ncbi:response regulator [Roseomonas sp. E05]|uniref:response regulator n=1 Tax=Roseomonas sp. E05 TaxID=3046310 RepID=UPI0024B8DFCE|nr:hybrid sensor histidine kinase/response regulator [Roseomonas sp. E05]MDJ0387139.1 response regulator [Roseomonas sp. E05]